MNEQDLSGLRAAYRTWNIRPSSEGGCLLATRLDRLSLTDAELVAGLHMTLVEETPDSLAHALAAQTDIEDAL